MHGKPLASFDWGLWLICWGSLLLLSGAATTPAVDKAGPVPLIHGHAHNDYEHPRPLFDALDCGYCSIEADVVLRDQILYVAHGPEHIRPQLTLENTYLKPLAERIARNGGRVYPGGPAVVLLIDFKSDPAETYRTLKPILSRYAGVLTHWSAGGCDQRALTVVLTGNSARDLVAAGRDRLVACDGALADLDSNPPVNLVPMISSRWQDSFTWTGRGDFPASEMQKLRKIVDRAHRQKRTIRFWGATDHLAAWRALRRAGVDWINTDRLKECRDFLLKEAAEAH